MITETSDSVRRCPKCGGQVVKSALLNVDYFCPDCDSDFTESQFNALPEWDEKEKA